MGNLNEIQKQTTQSYGDNSFTTTIKENTVEFDSLKDSFTFNDEVNVPSLKVNGQEITPTEPQVQADWDQPISTESDYILNKPAIKAGQGENSIIEGDIDTNVAGVFSHAEGYRTEASGNYGSHAEGNETTASGTSSHAEGTIVTASGTSSHAEGFNTTASGSYSHTEGHKTTAKNRSQHAFGEYNELDPSTALSWDRGTYIEIVGKGADENTRSNARTLDWQGNEYIQGTEEALLFIGHAPSNENINGTLVWDIAKLQRLKFVTLNSATNTLTLPNGGNKPFSMQMKVIQDATGGRGLAINCAGGVNVFNMNDFDFSVGAATQRCLVTLLWDSSEWWYSCSEYFG